MNTTVPPAHLTVNWLAGRYFDSQEFKRLRSRVGEEARFHRNTGRLIGGLLVADLTMERIEWYRETRSTELGHKSPTKAGTRNREIAKLSAVLTWAARQKLIATNPIRGVLMEDGSKPARPCPGTVDVDAILTEAGSLRLRAMIVTAFCTGLRRSELLSLQVDNIRWDDGLISVEARPGKGGGRTRIAILSAQARSVIRDYLEERRADGTESSLLFCTNSGRRVSGRNFLRDFQAAVVRAGIPGGEALTVRDLRAGFVRLQLEQGTPLEVIKAMADVTTEKPFAPHGIAQSKNYESAIRVAGLEGVVARTQDGRSDVR